MEAQRVNVGESPQTEYNTTERIGIIVATLYTWPYDRRAAPTTADLAQLVGLTHGGMWAMLSRLSRVLPIYNEVDGWYVCPN